MSIGRTVEIASTSVLALVVGVAAVLLVRRGDSPQEAPASAVPPPVTQVANWETVGSVARWRGSDRASIRIVEFADLQCPACREAHGTLRRIRERYRDKVSTAFVHFPLSVIHPFARPAAKAAECAAESDKFDAFVDAAFARQDSLGLRSWTSFAADAGIKDSVGFTACLEDSRALLAVDRGVRVGDSLQVLSTPTFLINGWRVSGAIRETDFTRIVDSLLVGRVPPGAVESPQVVVGADSALGLANVDVSARQVSQYSLSREAQLTTADGVDFDLTHVEVGTPLADGRLATYSPIGSRFLIFDTFGRGAGVLARGGNGPTEVVRALNYVQSARDTFALVDIGARRVTRIAADKGAFESYAVTGALRPGTRIAGVLPGNRIVTHTAGTRQAGATAAAGRSQATVSVVDQRTARDIFSFADLFLVDLDMKYGDVVSRSTGRLRLSGSSQVAVWDTLIAVVPVDQRNVLLFDARGRQVKRIKLPFLRRATTQAMRNRQMEEELTRLRESQQERPVNLSESERLAREAPFADSLAFSQAIFASNDGALWVVEAIAPGDNGWSAWSFRRDGTVSKWLAYTGKGVPIGFMNNRVALRTEDRDGVVHVSVHQIVAAKRQ